jgi:dTDP-4-amino-4,6-dideoxygalactose transaminase
LEDACQAIGGSYEGQKLGAIGHAGAFSFNYYKNITSGEAGGLTTNDTKIAERARAAIDPCNFYWQGHSDSVKPFAGVGARASELTGAMLNVQLGRLDGFVSAMRKEKTRILAGIEQLGNAGLTPAKRYSDTDCATQVLLLLPDEEAASKFVTTMPSVIAGKTGRHNFPQWDQVLSYSGAHHPALNPYTHPANAGCRTTYPEDLCKRSLDIVNRTVMIATHPLHSDEDIENIIHNISAAARVALENAALDEVDLKQLGPVELGKYDRASQRE